MPSTRTTTPVWIFRQTLRGLSLLFLVPWPLQATSPERPNVILMMADDLGWGDAGYNGHSILRTPHLDEMSRQGLRFNRFYAASSVCSPTRGACLTGRHPYRYGVYTANAGHLRDEEVSLAEVMKDHGYATGHFGKWHLGTLTPEYSGKGLGRKPQENYSPPGRNGFDEWFSTEFAVATWDPYDPAHSHLSGKMKWDPRALYWHNWRNVIEPLQGDYSRIIMDRVIPFIENAVERERPFFAVIWFHTPHMPVVGGPEYRAMYTNCSEEEQHYYACITALDEQVGRLRTRLSELGVAKNTMVWFCSDNGPEGNPGPQGRSQGSAGVFRGRKRSLYEGGIRVPGLLVWPAKITSPRQVDVPCVTSDYFPTILDVLGEDLPPARPYDGVSLMPLMEGGMLERPQPIGFQFGTQAALSDNRFKLVQNTGKKRPSSDNGQTPYVQWELYDLLKDPSETTNIAAQHPAEVERLKSLLADWIGSCQRSNDGADYQRKSHETGETGSSRSGASPDAIDRPFRYEPTWDSLKTAPVPEWFDDAKFGIFIHWGAYSVIGHRKGGRGYVEHVPKQIYAEPEYYHPYLDGQFGGHPPEFGYKDIVRQFRAERWDPEDWAALFAKAGAKYVILTGEHHDGFALWDSELTDWCATKVGPMRDLVGDLGKAVRAKGLKYAPSYHRERHPGFFAQEIYAIQSEPQPDVAEEIRRQPKAEGLYGPSSYTDDFIADYLARWKELQDKYRPDFLWIDDIPIFYKAPGDPQTQKFFDAFKPMIADYFNAAQQWGKDVYLNNKGAHLNWPAGLGCREKDNLNFPVIGPKWQNPATLGTSYGYMLEEEQQDAYKSATALLHLLIDVVSKNGNLLLNIGPRADGTIPDGMRQRLLAMGEWLAVHGEAIYGTRCWKEYGEGPELFLGKGASSDGEKAQRKPRTQLTPYTSESIRFTQSKDGNSLYAIQLVWPDDGTTVITRLGRRTGLLDRQIEDVSLLGAGGEVTWLLTDRGLELRTTAEKPNDHAYVWKIKLKHLALD